MVGMLLAAPFRTPALGVAALGLLAAVRVGTPFRMRTTVRVGSAFRMGSAVRVRRAVRLAAAVGVRTGLGVVLHRRTIRPYLAGAR